MLCLNKVLYGNTRRELTSVTGEQIHSRYMYNSFAVRTNNEDGTHYNTTFSLRGKQEEIRAEFIRVVGGSKNERRVLNDNLSKLDLPTDRDFWFAINITATGYEIMILISSWEAGRDECGHITESFFKGDFIVIDADVVSGKQNKIRIFKEHIERHHSMKKKLTHRLKLESVETRGRPRKISAITVEAAIEQFEPKQAEVIVDIIETVNDNVDVVVDELAMLKAEMAAMKAELERFKKKESDELDSILYSLE